MVCQRDTYQLQMNDGGNPSAHYLHELIKIKQHQPSMRAADVVRLDISMHNAFAVKGDDP